MLLEELLRIDGLDNDSKAVIIKMISDDISILAKGDPIIITIGARTLPPERTRHVHYRPNVHYCP